MSIVPPFPFTLTNGTTADASQVQADLNSLRDNINANAQPIGGGAGNVAGPASAVSGNLAVFDGTTGKIIKDGGAIPSGGGSYRGAVANKITLGQTISSGTGAIVSFNNNIIDTDSIHNASVNNTRMTVPTGVTVVRIFSTIAFSGSSVGGEYAIRVYKNGGQIFTLYDGVTTTTFGLIISVSSPAAACTAGDYFELLFVNGGSSTVTISQSSTGYYNVGTFEMQILQ